MGLLQDSKSRKKISNDPNNTKWTRDTTTFGQKILRAQGWQPGQFLGAQDAPHAELHSAASASYIRVVLKDDMKGLGFNKAKEDEVTGLDVFSDLLSRLNGKSEAAVQEDVNARLAVKTNRYVEMRWGPMRFVRGGLLVGDKLKEDGGKETSTESEEEEEEEEEDKAKAGEVAKSKKDKKSKKRKAGDEEEEAEESEVTEIKDKKRRRKDEDEDAKTERKKRRKEEKKREKKKSKKSSKSTKKESDEDDSDKKSAKKRAKKDKKDKKRERREKKEEKKHRKAAKVADNSSDNSSSSDSDSDNDNGDSTTAASTPATGSGTSTPLGNRNFSRSRYIAQKRRAVMDAKALAQIFMVKA